MNIYLNDNNIDSFVYSTIKSIGKVMACCHAATVVLSHFHTRMGLLTKFILPDFRFPPNIFLLYLLSWHIFTQIILILST